MNFIFFGRLAKEKGFDLLVRSLSCLVGKTGTLPGNVFVFGEGNLKEMLFTSKEMENMLNDCSGYSEMKLAELIEVVSSSEMGDEPKIYFFGWQAQSTIRDFLRISHFALMPSRFLETFGLSALESLSEGVPVIGFQKGGLVPFIQPGLAIPFTSDDAENVQLIGEKLQEIANVYEMDDSLEYDESKWSALSHESRLIADMYTEERWIERVRETLPEGTQRILIASDYTTLLGGIETHVQTIARVLRAHGYEVEVFGWDIPKGRWTKILRLLGLVYSFCNTSSLLTLRKQIRAFQPDAIWLHSVSRFLGPLVVREVTNSGIFSLVTYHDLGIFSPFPSQVESEEMIPSHPGLVAFVSAIRSANPFVYMATYCKYLQVYLLRQLLAKIDTHLVPSLFLAHHVQSIIKVPEERIVVLEHFL